MLHAVTAWTRLPTPDCERVRVSVCVLVAFMYCTLYRNIRQDTHAIGKAGKLGEQIYGFE